MQEVLCRDELQVQRPALRSRRRADLKRMKDYAERVFGWSTLWIYGEPFRMNRFEHRKLANHMQYCHKYCCVNKRRYPWGTGWEKLTLQERREIERLTNDEDVRTWLGRLKLRLRRRSPRC